MPKDEKAGPRIPLRHLSVRVPWHDAGWDGTVCRSPRQNSSCLALNRIGSTKNEAIEDRYAGQLLTDIPGEHVPPCFAERVSAEGATSYRSSCLCEDERASQAHLRHGV
jgi:hypothetical protein